MNDEKIYSQVELDRAVNEQVAYTREKVVHEYNSTYRYPLEREIDDLKERVAAKDKTIESLSNAVMNLSKGGKNER